MSDETLTRYADWAPSQFDTAGLNAETLHDVDVSEWFVGPGRTRDSDALTESNFRTFEKCLADDGAQPGEDWITPRFGHWGPGWIEIYLIRPGSPAEKTLRQCLAALADYPVLDESDYSELETERATETWQNMSMRERIRLCAKCGVSIFAARHDYYPSDACGRVEEYLRD